jgi:hypothetical protein
MCFSRSRTSSPSGSQIISWSDLSTSSTMTRQGLMSRISIPILSLKPDGQQEVAQLDRQLNSTRLAFWLSESLWGTQWRCLMFDSKIQRIDKPIYSLCSFFGMHILRPICRTEGTEEKGSSDKANRIGSFTSSRPSSLDDDEISSEFRPKIASLQNIIWSHSRTRRHSLGTPQ